MESDSEFEEMLFGSSSSQYQHDDWNDSDDDILDAFHGDGDNLPQYSMPQRPADDSSAPTNDVPREANELSTAVPNRDHVIAKIEDLLGDIVDGLFSESGCTQLAITLRTRSCLSRRKRDKLENINAIPQPKTQEFTYPGNTVQDAWKFTVVVRILELIHGCLVDNVVMTKRDLYYRHPDLFGKQSVVDQYVDDIACTFEVPRAHLNLTAAAKGLIAGNFVIRRGDGHAVHGLSEQEGVLVPTVQQGDALDLSLVRWILVIEKEATFRSVVCSTQWRELGTHGLVLTAKGYPDLASRKFLRHVSDSIPDVPIFALVDYDPDGIAIMSTYKYGSHRLAHEDVAHLGTPGLKLPDLRWLGVQSHHMSRTPVDEGGTATAALAELQGLMRLSGRDRSKAQRMLEWDLCAEDGPEAAWRAELQRMLMLNIKAEMQILDELPGGLMGWLSKTLEETQGGQSDANDTGSDDEMLL